MCAPTSFTAPENMYTPVTAPEDLYTTFTVPEIMPAPQECPDCPHECVEGCPDHWQSGEYNMVIRLHSDLADIVNGDLWEARLEVVARDVPTLLMEGINWDEAEIAKELYGPYLTPFDRLGGRGVGGFSSNWPLARGFVLYDTHENMRWIARLTYAAERMEVLSDFNLGKFTPEKITMAHAMYEGYTCYSFTRGSSDPKCNLIYYAQEVPVQDDVGQGGEEEGGKEEGGEEEEEEEEDLISF